MLTSLLSLDCRGRGGAQRGRGGGEGKKGGGGIGGEEGGGGGVASAATVGCCVSWDTCNGSRKIIHFSFDPLTFLEGETLIIHAGGSEPRVDGVIDWPPTGRRGGGGGGRRGWRTAALHHLRGSRHYRSCQGL